MTIPLHSAPLQALEIPLWSWVSWNDCWLENKGKHMGEVMRVFIFVNVRVVCDYGTLNCWEILCDYGIIFIVRAFEYICSAWTCIWRKHCKLEYTWWWTVTIWNFECTIDHCISSLNLVMCIYIEPYATLFVNILVELIDLEFYLRTNKSLGWGCWWVSDFDSFRALF